jgi:hypothetical protein
MASQYVFLVRPNTLLLPISLLYLTDLQAHSHDRFLIISRAFIRNGIMPHLWGINLLHIYAREVR